MSNLVYDASNGLFKRLGVLIYFMDQVRAHQANLKTLLANVRDEYSSADTYMIESLVGNIDARIEEAGGVLQDVRAAAERTLQEMCFASATDSGSSIPMISRDTYDAIVWLIRAMRQDSETIERNVVNKSSLTVGSSNNGNGKFYYSFATPKILLDGNAEWENTRTEIVQARCIEDAQSFSLEPGSEIFQLVGQPAYDPLDYRFPAGSGVSIRVPSICASVDAGVRFLNVLTNSDFEDFTSNVPDQFSATTGTAGTDFGAETTNVYRGSKALELKASGNVFSIRQQFGAGGGTIVKLIPDRAYVLAAAVRKNASATGVLRISVKDAGGTILDSGNFALSVDVGAAATTSYALFSSVVRTPRVIPTATYLVIETTTAIATAAAQLDEVVLAEMVQIGNGGPYVAIVAGSNNWNVDDTAQFSFTNTDNGKFVGGLDRLFNMYGRGLLLPSATAGSETILDSLIA